MRLLTDARLTALAGVCVALAVGVAGCLAPAAVAPPSPPAVHGTLSVTFLDVGQGDGVVWQLPDGSIVVYDCGPPADNASSNPVNQYLASIGVAAGSKIWAVVASHGHLDHMGGCEEVLAQYEVQHIYEVWYEGRDAPNSYNRWITQVINENATVHTASETPFLDGEVVFHQGDALALPPEATADGLRVQILWPPAPHIATWSEVAYHSIVLRWSFGSADYCTAGDIEFDQEAALAGLARDLNCEVYLVGHHGSQASSSTPWLQKMGPKIAVVSFGANDYGHPTSQALCRVQSVGAKVYATDRIGNVKVSSDGTAFLTSPDLPETRDYCRAGASYWPTPVPPPPPTPAPAPTSNLSLTATAHPSAPCQYTTVTVSVHVERGSAPVAGANVSSTWYYKTSDATEVGVTDGGGDVDLSRYISGASAGYQVDVEVTASDGPQSATAVTSFTPKAC